MPAGSIPNGLGSITQTSFPTHMATGANGITNIQQNAMSAIVLS